MPKQTMAHPAFVDIHCHLLPFIDDGAKSMEDSLQMARIAVADGIETIIATPHQLGNYAANDGNTIRQRVRDLQDQLDANAIPLQVLPGGDVRIEDTVFAALRNGTVLTLGDHDKHVLLELPHELYLPMTPIVERLASLGMHSILSHPERNHGILREPNHAIDLVQNGCFMQVTAASLVGTFGSKCQQFSEWMLANGLVHFMATDAHGPVNRRPLMQRCYERVRELTNAATAEALCCVHPAAVATGQQFQVPRSTYRATTPSTFKKVTRPRGTDWFGRRRSA